jgi:cell surface protein SprA
MNIGFTYNPVSQVNKRIWLDAFMEHAIRDGADSLAANNKAHADSLQAKQPVVQDTTKNSQPLPSATGKTSSIKLVDSLGGKPKSDSLPLIKADSSKTVRDSLKGKLPGSKAPLKDSLKTKADIPKVDSTKFDSTARIKYFKTKRADVPYTTLLSHKPSKLFAMPSQFKKSTEIDTADGKNVTVAESVGGTPIHNALTMTMSDYIALKLTSHERESWEDIVYKYEMKDMKKDLGNLIKDFTDFEIPLPSVGVLSIFGAPKISLKIGGAVDIHGAWRNETTEGVTASSLGNTRNEPDFRQQVQINVNGTIGDKLQISADWNTERTFEYENQLHIKYTGYEDEIIQSIEAGNVSLETSSLVGGSEALFGIKANFKLGPLSLTALASQKKGEIKEKSVSGGSSSQPFTLRAYNYSKNHYFVDQAYADTTQLNLFYNYYAKPTPGVNTNYSIYQIEVWKSINQVTTDPNEWMGNAYIDLPENTSTLYTDGYRTSSITEVPGEVVRGRFVKLTEGTDYTVHPETGFITFKTSIQDQDIIAVAYVRGDGKVFGELSKNLDKTKQSSVVLKLVKPQNLQPQYKKAWNLQLKNIYAIGSRNIKKDGFTCDIKYEVDGSDPQATLGSVRLLTAFGLDLLDASNNPQPDGVFDFRVGYTILPETGEIIFPTLQPFGRNFPANIPNHDSLRYNDVYDTTVTYAQQNKVKDKFEITGQSTGESSSTYQLGFNVVENSVKVTLNGRELTNNVDYSVDYNIGTLTIKNESALVSGANLKISYEENDLFQIASKTLFGFRGIIDISNTTKLGFSMLTLSEQTLSDKVRIGEEPKNNSIYGLDFTTGTDLPLVSRLLDKIISTKETSNFGLKAEVALMNPDPNTKKSTVASDNGNNIAYVDDFEGSKRIIPVGVGYTSWKDLSVPTNLNAYVDTMEDMTKMKYKAKTWWYNVLPSDVSVNTIWPLKKVATSDQLVTVLDFVYDPTLIGAYNRFPSLSDHSKNWGGMMKLLSSTASNLVEENIEYIEFWVNVQNAEPNAKINIDLGQISEDVIPNGVLDSEDKNSNELLDNGEDTGLDGLFDADERAKYGSTESDPSHDNFSFSGAGSKDPDKYQNINGTEGNSVLTDVGRLPDTEDLNHNGTLDKTNSYFRYEIPLDTNSATNKYIAGGGSNSWYQFKVPLKDYTLAVGSPSLTVVEGIRVFVSGLQSRLHFRMTEFNLVGNQWQKETATDSVLELSVVSVEDNPDYTMPSGVSREQDKTQTTSTVYRNEQSLSLIVNDLPEGQSREAVKYLSKSLDIFNYSQMKLFVHPNTSTGVKSLSYYKSVDEYASEVFFRFGTDTNNFYEYRQPLRDNVNSNNWDEITIVFKELTAIKQARGDTGLTQDYRVPVAGKEGHYYVVRGRPALTAIKFLAIGVTNKADENPLLKQPVSGILWVDELRVIGADNTKGWAYSVATTLKLADLMTINYNLSKTDPYFHKLSEQFGSRTESDNWGISADVDLLKILPLNSQDSNLKLNYSRTESVGKPLFLPSSDILVSEAQKLKKEQMLKDGATESQAQAAADQIAADAESFNMSESYTLSNIKLRIPSDYWLIQDSFNSLTFGYTFNKTFSRNPTTLESNTWVWNATMAYQLNLSPDYSVTPAKIPILGTPFALSSDYRQFKFYYLPQSFSWNIGARRNYSYNVLRATSTTDATATPAHDFVATRNMIINWKMTENGFLNLSSSYNHSATSSLDYLQYDDHNAKRPEMQIWRDIFTKEFFGQDRDFQQNIDFKTSPKLPNIFDIGKYLTVTAGYSVGYGWLYDVRQGDLGHSATSKNTTSLGFSLRLKSLFEPLFKEELPKPLSVAPKPSHAIAPAQKAKIVKDSTGNVIPDDKLKAVKDSTVQDSASVVSGSGLASKLEAIKNSLLVLKMLAKTLFFDYENINVSFSNSNSYGSSGLKGSGNGFRNLWNFSYDVSDGPSRAFMLGLSGNPGPRAKNGTLTDNFQQTNNLEFKTSRPLWEGAKIDLNWKTSWSINKTATLVSDSLGNVTINNINSSGTLTRSFFSMPPVFVMSIFKSGIKKVHELYEANGETDLTGAFLQGFESMPIISKIGFLHQFANYIPRANWRISWDGLEKLPLFKSFAKKVSLDHAYQSDYTEAWKLDGGVQSMQSQRATIGFQPLVGLNMTFFDLWNGNFSGSVKYSTSSGYDVAVTTKKITDTYSKDVGITLNYTKQGFEVPFFGISLKNDIEFSVSYTTTQNSVILYDMADYTDAGVPQNGTVRTSLEPRIKYVMSSRVTASIYYKRSSTKPEGASNVTATTTNEAGVDVRISIQ